jgi:hypothetical protein
MKYAIIKINLYSFNSTTNKSDKQYQIVIFVNDFTKHSYEDQIITKNIARLYKVHWTL